MSISVGASASIQERMAVLILNQEAENRSTAQSRKASAESQIDAAVSREVAELHEQAESIRAQGNAEFASGIASGSASIVAGGVSLFGPSSTDAQLAQTGGMAKMIEGGGSIGGQYFKSQANGEEQFRKKSEGRVKQAGADAEKAKLLAQDAGGQVDEARKRTERAFAFLEKTNDLQNAAMQAAIGRRA